MIDNQGMKIGLESKTDVLEKRIFLTEFKKVWLKITLKITP